MYRLRLITFVYEAVAHRADRLRSFTFPAGGSGEGGVLYEELEMLVVLRMNRDFMQFTTTS